MIDRKDGDTRDGASRMRSLTPVPFPADSALAEEAVHADFADAWRAPLRNPEATPAEIFITSAQSTPEWVNVLMSLRNGLARAIGLKDVGAMAAGLSRPSDDYRRGDRMGIFTVIDSGQRELVLGIDDSHLDVRVSVLKSDAPTGATCTISTVVRIKNLIGRIYMFPVGYIHPWVVRSLLERGHP